ncbi:MAG: SGNH/GDSL hydrolase family protein [Ruminococcaceae bacterium]|nr:SGNH/GDSL hydrolase family protein [Oscillospiraceae bacterium]
MLENTIYRLNKEKKLRVGYFGGSITEGAGASEWNRTSWRARITTYLRGTYPDAEITEIMAAVGGTGTDLGLCRCEHDLLSNDPDLVFIEFAVNDSGLPAEEQMPCYENCLRQILNYKNTIDVVCVFSATKSTETQILETGDFPSRTVQAMLAHHYGLPTADPGDMLRNQVALAGGNWLNYTTDNTHPNDEGHLIYTDVMKNALETWLSGETPDSLREREIPAPLSAADLTPGKLIDLCDCTDLLSDFTFIDKPFKKRFPHYFKANGIGSTIRYTFEGTGFGLYWIMDNESGAVTVTLDGKETKTLYAWDEYCKSFSRGCHVFPFKNLEFGKHTVEIRVSEEKHPDSNGNDISIYAFLTL